jgi:hypothetical protein
VFLEYSVENMEWCIVMSRLNSKRVVLRIEGLFLLI